METPGSYKWRSKWPGNGGPPLLSRRFLLVSAFTSVLGAQKAEVSQFDFSLLDDWLTPSDLFFVREHFPAPKISSYGWKLSIGGTVAAPYQIPYDDLLRQTRQVLVVTLECAENPTGGGLVSNARWEGVSLAALLEKAQPQPGARFVRFQGADGDYSRTIPLAKALHPDTLLAHRMNGEPLPQSHGFPLRALIPGWYSMDSVKWLRSVELTSVEDLRPAYRRHVQSLLAGARVTDPVTAIGVNSAFARPVDGAILTGRRLTIRGAAWAGENRVRAVEISTDGGKLWQATRLEGSPPQPYAWVQWAYDWKIPGPGRYELVLRAMDDQGRQQPEERPADRLDDYERNVRQRIAVTVT